MIVATSTYDDGDHDVRSFDTRKQAVKFAEEECKWEGTVSVVLKGHDDSIDKSVSLTYAGEYA